MPHRLAERWRGQRWVYRLVAMVLCLFALILWFGHGIGCELSDPGTQSELYFARCDVDAYRQLPLAAIVIMAVGFTVSLWIRRWWPRTVSVCAALAALALSYALFAV
jgi:hypothetical protein